MQMRTGRVITKTAPLVGEGGGWEGLLTHESSSACRRDSLMVSEASWTWSPTSSWGGSWTERWINWWDVTQFCVAEVFAALWAGPSSLKKTFLNVYNYGKNIGTYKKKKKKNFPDMTFKYKVQKSIIFWGVFKSTQKENKHTALKMLH